MPTYYLDSQLISMYYNSIESNNDDKFDTIKHYISIINSYNTAQKLHTRESTRYYMLQLDILYFTHIIEKIINLGNLFTYNSIITNENITHNEEKVKLIKACANIILLEKEKQKKLLTNNKYKTLILGNMTQIFPSDILENIAYQLTSKKRSTKKQSTNWQNFCKQRKKATLNHKDNSDIWKSLNHFTKNKYKNPYYKHF